MTFLTYKRDAEERLGVLDRDGARAIDLADAAQRLGEGPTPKDMLQLIELGDAAAELARRIADRSGELPDSAFFTPNGNAIAPIPRPRKNVFAVGLNYVRHTREFTGSDRLPENPIIFTKAASSVVGPGATVRLRPDLSEQIDYEGELGVVIGKRGADIPAERAFEHIFGYTIVNDVTARDLQKRTSQWFLGKSLDTFCPMGPYLVHKSTLGWPLKVAISTKVNGELRQQSNTELLYFDIPKLIATVSAGITLEPGDIIATGTPEGVGMGFQPPKFLRSGDVVEIEIEGIGVLRNPVG